MQICPVGLPKKGIEKNLHWF